MTGLQASGPQGHAAAWLLAIGAAWSVATVAGFAALADYGAEPGAAARPPAQWPEETPLRADPLRATLLVFCHPHCPCTRATLAELERLLARCPEPPTVTAVFFAADSLGEGWERSPLWDRAAAMQGVRPFADPRGEVARTFGVRTSGTALLYSQSGQLAYSGGLTPGRGHEGDNVGAAAIVALATTGRADVDRSAVYGCPLLDPAVDIDTRRSR